MSTPISGSTTPSSSAPDLDIIFFPYPKYPEEMSTGDDEDDLIVG